MAAIIEVSGLTKHFGDIKAVDNLSFTVNEGDVYGFLGQNGAGKSTTIRMLLSLITATRGQIAMFGYDLAKHRNKILSQVGAVIEKPDVYNYLTAFENLQLFSRLSGVKVHHHELVQHLELVGLTDRANSKVKTFSQGMKQRLGIAIALAHNPKLIILDEPTNGLDPQGIADIRNLILNLSQKRGKTIVVSSHLLSEVQLIANRLLIIDKGRKLVEGTAAELFNPNETIVELDTTDNTDTLQVLHQSIYNENLQQPRNGKLYLKINRSAIAGFHKSLVEMGVGVISLQPRHSLEDYFLQVTTQNNHVEAFAN